MIIIVSVCSLLTAFLCLFTMQLTSMTTTSELFLLLAMGFPTLVYKKKSPAYIIMYSTFIVCCTIVRYVLNAIFLNKLNVISFPITIAQTEIKNLAGIGVTCCIILYCFIAYLYAIKKIKDYTLSDNEYVSISKHINNTNGYLYLLSFTSICMLLYSIYVYAFSKVYINVIASCFIVVLYSYSFSKLIAKHVNEWRYRTNKENDADGKES